MVYDLAIVGAGPAGLQAAKSAAHKGLKVILLEREKDISRVTRACSMNLIMDEDYLGETLKYEKGKLIFTKNKFEVPYSGHTYPVTDKYYVSPAGNRIHFAYKDHRPITLKYSKGILLKGLLEDCQCLKVEYRNETLVDRVGDSPKAVELKTTSEGVREKVKAKKAILADGVNSRTSHFLGLNRDRVYLGTAKVTIKIMEGIESYDPHAWNLYFGRAYHSNLPLFMGTGPVPQCDTLAEFGNSVMSGGGSCEELFQNVVKHSPLARRFRKAKIKKMHCCSVKSYTPMKVPYKGNVLVVGDAAALVETQVQGALCCGFRASHAVAEELEGKRVLRPIQNGGSIPLSLTQRVSCKSGRAMPWFQPIRMMNSITSSALSKMRFWRGPLVNIKLQSLSGIASCGISGGSQKRDLSFTIRFRGFSNQLVCLIH